jgi:hypothetical protein
MAIIPGSVGARIHRKCKTANHMEC